MRYPSSPDLSRDGDARLGVLLVNSGTPDALTTRDVRRFLQRLLSDPRVVELPRALWLPILFGAILPLRPRRVLEKYRRIRTPEGSPLVALSAQLRAGLKHKLPQALPAPCEVELGMLYSSPSVAAGLKRLRDLGAQRILVLPLFPQYCGATTGAVHDQVSAELKNWRRLPELRYVGGYHDRPAYIEALRASVSQHETVKSQHLLISFHGIPERYHSAGDPYFRHCQHTARLLADRLNLRDGEWSVSFQSRFGAAEWLKPYTIDTVAQLARRGIGSLTVICPGFAVDCLETLEEIAMENRDCFLSAGGREFHYIPALNAHPAHVDLLSGLIAQHTQGWLDNGPPPRA